ncbi:MAG: hypothetical protein K2J11_00470 [Oscillospiraceae bacterium]|nr:hypothetical protein [Oscillospiraceae bacterium]
MRFKKPIATILAAAMMLSSLPMLAFADEEVEPVPVPVPVRDVCEDESHTSTVMVVASGNASRHEVHCADCDKLKGDGSEDHNREASENSPVSQNASGHTMKCTHCTITWTEPHDTDGVDGECSVCGYDDALAPAVPVGPADCDHDNTHMIVATGNASKHEEYCDTCYSKRSEHYREASDDSPVSQNANGHTMKCDYCDITWTEPHDTDGTDGACSVCGYGADESDPSEPAKPVEPVDPDDCEHKNTQTIVATGNASKHEEYCVKCNSKQSEHDREASDGFVSKNEKGHTVKCKHCDLTWVVSHDTDGADGACSVCGYKPEPVEPKPVEPAVPVDCNHKNTHTIVATGYASKHEEYCNTCNSKLSEHNREVNDEVPVSNGKSGHTVKCRYCSITWSEPHTYRDNGTCLLCGEMHEHVYSNVWEPFTDLHHAKRCTIVGCKYIIAEYHIDSNKDGACDVCGSTNMKNQTGGSSSANTPTIITDPTVTATPAIITAATTTSKFASTPKEIRN